MSDPAAAVRSGDRRALAKLITRIESTRGEDRAEAARMLDELLAQTGKSVRIGISGVPGVGKSSFIEALGLHAIATGHRVAVLAVDPSSPKTGGSILGDKTRMEELSRDERAFIRPSPSGRTLGGVARRTRETVLAVEAAGFDVVLVETVGVGQSEYAVAKLVDMFVLLVAPGGGDDLQGIKKGIVEMADMLVVTKDDGDLKPAAHRAFRDYGAALHMLSGGHGEGWRPKVLKCSAHTRDGIDGVWNAMLEFRDVMTENGETARRRADQAADWMWDEVTATLLERLTGDPAVAGLAADLEAAVRADDRTPSEAARAILDAFSRAPGSAS